MLPEFLLQGMLLIKRIVKQLLLLEQVVWRRWMLRGIWRQNIDVFYFFALAEKSKHHEDSVLNSK
jgi:hypothetical protein